MRTGEGGSVGTVVVVVVVMVVIWAAFCLEASVACNAYLTRFGLLPVVVRLWIEATEVGIACCGALALEQAPSW